MVEIEEWRPIPGYEGWYEASNIGRLRSLPRTTGTGKYARRLPGRVLNPSFNPREGRYYVGLNVSGRQRTQKVAVLICSTFHGPRPYPGAHCRHLDGNAINNHISNLAWGSPAENSADMRRHGTHSNTRKTHCKRGHPFNAENTRIMGQGGRKCITCAREVYLVSHCSKGHEFTAENTRTHLRSNGVAIRECRTCFPDGTGQRECTRASREPFAALIWENV